ncbi:KIF18A [Branchiostoma lanceolatum]|uniref:KIF18A protein n=1 Tax=Branchiostoma lanceolatum TaxID=7740 RepID=A0A8J9ZNF4_BRALA|nr:KIF18A [Branchiostoma lanceolatum]
MSQPPRKRRKSSSTQATTTLSGDDTQSSNMKVVVRVRPPNASEREDQKSRTIVRVMDEHLLVFDPKDDDASPNYYHGKRKRRDLLTRKNKDLKFIFDRVFNDMASQQEVYESTTKVIVDGVLNGYNCSVFAYGATGAGKTFTMLGAPQNPGVIFLTMMDLYQRIDQMQSEKICDVAVSYLEVYNETIRDLLVPSGTLAVREDPQKGVVVSGLTLHKPRSAEELIHMLEYGNQNRTQHPTDANATSSRSHAVFQVFVRQKDRTANISSDVRVAKMSLIDLAGSERATVTTNRGARFREGANINKSLLALGNCINALADPQYKGHIPYRNSKLTRLLKDSLGGNCRTVMIAAVSPSSLSYEDTHNTLKYANRAKNIRCTLKKNVVSVDFHVSRYAQICEDLRKEVTELKSKIKGYEDGSQLPPPPAVDDAQQAEISRLQGILHSVFKERHIIRKDLQELEMSHCELKVKVHRKERDQDRVKAISSDNLKATGRLERAIAAAKTRQAVFQDRLETAEKRMKENCETLEKVEEELRGQGTEGELPEAVQFFLHTHHLEVEVKDLRKQVKHLKKFAKSQEKDSQASEKLIVSLLEMARRQYFLLKGAGMATSDVTSEFEAVQRMVEGEKEVMWADQSMLGNRTQTGLDLTEVLDLSVMSVVSATPPSGKTPCRTPVQPQPKRVLLTDPNTTSCTPNGTVAEPSPFRVVATPLRVPVSDKKTVQKPPTPQRVVAASPCPSTPQRVVVQSTPTAPTPMRVPVGPSATISQTTPAVSNGITQGTITKALPGRVAASTVTKGTVTKTMSAPVRVHGKPDRKPQSSRALFTEQAQPNRTEEYAALQPHLGPGPLATSSMMSEDSLNLPYDKTVVLSSSQTVSRPEDLPVVKQDSTREGSTGGTMGQVQEGQPVTLAQAVSTNTPNNQSAAKKARLDQSYVIGGHPSTPAMAMETEETNAGEGERRMTFTKDDLRPEGQENTASCGTFPTPGHSTAGKRRSLGDVNAPVAGQHVEQLRKVGLPSMMDKGVFPPPNKPSYMSMTASAAIKRRKHRRSVSSRENFTSKERQSPVAKETTKPAGTRRKFGFRRSLAHARSKSAGNLLRWQGNHTSSSRLPIRTPTKL